MVLRPYSAACGRQDVSFNDVETKADQKVEIPGADLFDRLSREAMHESFPDRFDRNALNSRQHGGTIHYVSRMLARFLPVVELEIKIVQRMFSKLRVKQAPPQTGKDSAFLSFSRSARSVDQELDPGEIAGLNVLDDFGVKPG